MNDEPEIKIEALAYPEKVYADTKFIITWNVRCLIGLDKVIMLVTTISDENLLMERKMTVPSFFYRILYYILRLFGIKNLKHRGKTTFNYYVLNGINKNTTYTITAGYDQIFKADSRHKV